LDVVVTRRPAIGIVISASFATALVLVEVSGSPGVRARFAMTWGSAR
jgi:hypothetical protein